MRRLPRSAALLLLATAAACPEPDFREGVDCVVDLGPFASYETSDRPRGYQIHGLDFGVLLGHVFFAEHSEYELQEDRDPDELIEANEVNVLTVLMDLFNLFEHHAYRDGTGRSSHHTTFFSLVHETVSVYEDRADDRYEHITQVLGYQDPPRALFSSARSADGGSSWNTLLPLYSFSAEEHEQKRSSWIVPPLFHSEVDETIHQRAIDVLWPIFRTESLAHDGAPPVTRWHLLPVLWYEDGPAASFMSVWPIVNLERMDDRRKWSVLPPLFFHGSDERGEWSETGILFPLAGSNRDARESHGEATRWLFPLWWWKDTLTDGNPTSSEGWVLWPAFRYDRRSDGGVHWDSFLFLADFESSAKRDSEDFEVLGDLYRSHRDGTRVQRSVPLLFGFERDDAGATLKLFHVIPISW